MGNRLWRSATNSSPAWYPEENSTTINNYFERANQIAEELNCKVWVEEDIYPQYFTEEMLVVCPPPTTQFKFLVLLHELGHIKLGHIQEEGKTYSNILWIPPGAKRIPGSYFTNGILRSETEAWQFALSNLHEFLEPGSKNWIKIYLTTYLKEAERSKGQLWQIYRPTRERGVNWISPPFRFDSPDYANKFLSLLDELEILTWTN